MTKATTPDITATQHAAEREMTPSSGQVLPTSDRQSPLFVIWTEIIERCSNPQHESYSEYGGQGIHICAEWRDFNNFQTWARANGYLSGRYLARIDLSSDYAPENCGWSTVPHGRFRPRRVYTALGETKSLTEWAKDPRCLVSFVTLNGRVLTAKWDLERALSTPAMHWEVRPNGYTLTTIPVGAQFGELTVIGPYLRTLIHAKSWRYTYPCRCSCGDERSVIGSSLLNGKATYCNTRAHALILGKAPGIHQGSATLLYGKWRQMRLTVAKEQRRCTPESGRRAVAICEEWQDFTAFRNWAIAQGYRDGFILNRRDPHGDFTPDNCVWIITKRAAEIEMTLSSTPALPTSVQHSPLFVIWTEIIERCDNPMHERYAEYGGQGIRVCAEWRDFNDFQTWARANGYLSGKYLARIDPNGDYTPANCGWSTVPHGHFRLPHRAYTAFGETKSLAEWGEDTRCKVSFGTLKSRVLAGKWDIERALSTPPISHPNGFTLSTIPLGAQFGELTVIGPCIRTELHRKKNNWRYTYLCRCACGDERPVLGFSLLNGKKTYCGTRAHALALGKTPITHAGSKTPLYQQWQQMRLKVAQAQRRGTVESGRRALGICTEWQDFSAFRDWAMAHGYREAFTLIRQNPHGDFTPENCAWAESKRLLLQEKAPERHHGSGTRLYEQWLQLRRKVAQVQRRFTAESGQRAVGICAEWDDFSAFRNWAMAHGYRDELYLIRRNPQGDYTPENCLWMNDETKSVPINGDCLLTAFGETKSFHEWLSDPRCVVSKSLVEQRVRNGQSLEAALSKPSNQKEPSHTNDDYTAFGETKSLLAWSRDPRCLVSHKLLYDRITRDWTIVAALTTPSQRQGLTAYGETKSFVAWSQDPRCCVTLNTIVRRLHAGWDAEKALSASTQHCHHFLTIFGETKLLTEWLNDPRCVVKYNTFVKRMQHGWDPERALTTPAVIGKNGNHGNNE